MRFSTQPSANLNDVEMLDFAGTAVLMGNATDTLKARAYQVTERMTRTDSQERSKLDSQGSTLSVFGNIFISMCLPPLQTGSRLEPLDYSPSPIPDGQPFCVRAD